jgi:VWFA-related protein
MFIGGRLGCLAMASALCAGVALAQQASPQIQSTAQTQAGAATQTGGSKISLDVVVTDKSGQVISGLQQQDFTLLDNKAPQTITSFAEINGRQATIEVIVVIDAVNAAFQNIAYERGQIDQFLRSEGGNLAYPLAIVVSTDNGAQIVGGFSSDGNALSATLDKANIGLRDFGRAGGYYGAAERVQLSLTALREIVASAAKRPGRKIIIWISPGWPLLSGSRTELDGKQEEQWFRNVVGISTELLRGNVTLYSVDPVGNGALMADSSYEYYLKPVIKPSQVQIGNMALQVLVVHSGGVPFSFSNAVTDRLHKCIGATVPYYEISFDAPAAQKLDEYHQLQVKLAKPGLTARTRTGYYAQP